jgi:hypothetical protein
MCFLSVAGNEFARLINIREDSYSGMYDNEKNLNFCAKEEYQ